MAATPASGAEAISIHEIELARAEEAAATAAGDMSSSAEEKELTSFLASVRFEGGIVCVRARR
jgi:hypothetical protein